MCSSCIEHLAAGMQSCMQGAKAAQRPTVKHQPSENALTTAGQSKDAGKQCLHSIRDMHRRCWAVVASDQRNARTRFPDPGSCPRRDLSAAVSARRSPASAAAPRRPARRAPPAPPAPSSSPPVLPPPPVYSRSCLVHYKHASHNTPATGVGCYETGRQGSAGASQHPETFHEHAGWTGMKTDAELSPYSCLPPCPYITACLPNP